MTDVCLVTGQFPPDTHGGAENYVLRTAKGLEARGVSACVLTTQPYDGKESLRPRKTEYDGLTVWRFYPANRSHISEGTGDGILSKAAWHAGDLANPHSAYSVGRVLDRLNPTVVHTNNLVGISAGIVPAIRRRDVHHVHTLHDYSLICPKGNLLRDLTAPDDSLKICEDPPVPCKAHAAVKRRLIGDPDVVTGPSQHVIDVHRNHGFFEDTATSCTPLGIDGSSIADAPTRGREPSVLYVGNIQRAKGIETLLDAAEELEGVQFEICGSGPFEQRVMERSESMDNVTFHGFVSDEKLAQLRTDAWAGVVPSIWMENSPFVIYESFAAGLPVVGSDVGGIPELVTNGVTGQLFEAGDDSQLRSAIRFVASNETEEQGRAALEWAQSHTVGDHIDRLFDEVYPPQIATLASACDK